MNVFDILLKPILYATLAHTLRQDRGFEGRRNDGRNKNAFQ